VRVNLFQARKPLPGSVSKALPKPSNGAIYGQFDAINLGYSLRYPVIEGHGHAWRTKLSISAALGIGGGRVFPIPLPIYRRS
jgi:hypothetical protein